jgi:endonuclease/exonuclease/phosphatase family metal-dependent hydrolase
MTMMRPATLLLFLLSLTGCAPLTEASREPERLRVLTYNIHHGEGTDRRLDLARVASVIKSAEPDVVALQEVDVKTRRSRGVDQAAELGRLTGMHVRFGKAIDFQGGAYGVAVLSRMPTMHLATEPLPAGPDGEQRCVLILLVRTRGHGDVLFANTHLDSSGPSSGRLAQVERLYTVAGSGPGPRILAGDLNAEPGSEPLQQLDEGWADTAPADAPPTYPSGEPRKRIDYVLRYRLYTDRWRVIETRVIDEKVASDHRPVLVVLELRR